MIQHIAVIGAGTMGHGIAALFAMHGYRVSLYEAFDAVRNGVMAQMRSELAFLAEEGHLSCDAIEGVLSRITLYGDLAPAVAAADFVVEAIPENLALKQDLFAQLDTLCPPHTIFASNTSSLPLTDMTVHLPAARQARSMVCHWYNPALVIPIVELSCFGNMDDDVFQAVYDLHIRAGKVPVKVLKDIPGLIANRMLHALAREVFHLVEIGAASPEDIDRALKFGPGFRAATTGILEVADMGGLDVWCAVEDNLFAELSYATRACDALRARVAAGKLGLKSGEGFFTYPPETREEAKRAFQRRLLVQERASRAYQ